VARGDRDARDDGRDDGNAESHATAIALLSRAVYLVDFFVFAAASSTFLRCESSSTRRALCHARMRALRIVASCCVTASIALEISASAAAGLSSCFFRFCDAWSSAFFAAATCLSLSVRSFWI